MKNFKIKKAFSLAFTLAEIMIALVVIGVITSILLPVAFNSVPDENVMKFKKGNATLAKVINELVSSDKYYSNGDLGKKKDGNLVDSSTYFCEMFSDIISTKKVNCVKRGDFHNSYWAIEQPESDLDLSCSLASKDDVDEITLIDDIKFYEGSTNIHFATKGTPTGFSEDGNDFSMDNDAYLFYDNLDRNNINRVYKVFCMDIDGIGEGEDPFGYGIRVDGKIVLGDRAKEWLSKSIQDKD